MKSTFHRSSSLGHQTPVLIASDQLGCWMQSAKIAAKTDTPPPSSLTLPSLKGCVCLLMLSLLPAHSAELFPRLWLVVRSTESLFYGWLWLKDFHPNLKKCSLAFKKLTRHPQIIQQHLGTTGCLRFNNTRP